MPCHVTWKLQISCDVHISHKYEYHDQPHYIRINALNLDMDTSYMD